MGTCFLYGSGANPLNFKIVGGTTEPENPKENMIWVNTDQKITGWIFSAAEPETPVEGLVWIHAGIGGSNVSFNALKKNNLQVYPLYAQQYSSGAWINVTAMSYQDGAWTEWLYGYLYYQGNEITNITDGWIPKTFSASDTWYTPGTVILGESSIKLTFTGCRGYIAATPKNKIDLTEYSKLTINVLAVEHDSTGYCELSIGDEDSDEYYNVEESALSFGRITETGENVLDISSLNGEYVVALTAVSQDTSGYATFEVDKVWLE